MNVTVSRTNLGYCTNLNIGEAAQRVIHCQNCRNGQAVPYPFPVVSFSPKMSAFAIGA